MFHQPIPRSLPGAPPWLTEVIWQRASALGDPHPGTIVIGFEINNHGRVSDRVWMRGNFACDCGIGLRGATWHGKIVGFTVDAETHRSVSSSLLPG